MSINYNDGRRKDYKRRYNDKGEVIEKKCNLCDKWKKIEEFVRDSSCKVDGYNFRCKNCVSDYKKRYLNGEISERGSYYRDKYDKEYIERKKYK